MLVEGDECFLEPGGVRFEVFRHFWNPLCTSLFTCLKVTALVGREAVGVSVRKARP